MIPRLKEQYEKTIISEIQKKLSMKNKLMVPKLIKVVLNMGLGLDGSNKTILKNCIEDMGLISGQKPVTTRFKKSISNFKSRKGTIAGLKVTLRGYKMYEFIDRLVNIALPRIKDFRGLSPRNMLFFQKLILIKLTELEAWILLFQQVVKLRKPLNHCW